MKLTLISYVNFWDYMKSGMLFENRYCLDSFHPINIRRNLISLLEQHKDSEVAFVSCHEEIFNMVGHLIMKGKINADDVKVILFNEDHSMLECGYDKEGFLAKGYQYGYFNYGGYND